MYSGAVDCRKMAFAAVVSFVDVTNSVSVPAYTVATASVGQPQTMRPRTQRKSAKAAIADRIEATCIPEKAVHLDGRAAGGEQNRRGRRRQHAVRTISPADRRKHLPLRTDNPRDSLLRPPSPPGGAIITTLPNDEALRALHDSCGRSQFRRGAPCDRSRAPCRHRRLRRRRDADSDRDGRGLEGLQQRRPIFAPATRRSKSRTPTIAPPPKRWPARLRRFRQAIADLGERSALDPNLAQAMNRLPAIVKSRAMGGTPAGSPLKSKDQEPNYAKTLSALASPDDTFGLLRTLLDGLENRLHVVARDVDRRNALAAATPSMWPSYGWLSSGDGSAQGSDYRRQRLSLRPRHRRRTRPAGLRDRRRHGRAGRVAGRLRQPDRDRSRLRPRDALRPPAEVASSNPARRSSAATSSVRSAPPAAPRDITSTTRCWPTAGCSIRSSSSRRNRATGKSPASLRFPCRSVAPRLQSVDIHVAFGW